MNRKKISLKGALLALAVIVPPLISSTVFTTPMQKSINQSQGLIDHGKTFSSLSEPYNEVNQDLSVINDDLTQVEPLKASLSKIKSFKWIKYRTRSEIETQVHDLIVSETKQNLVELNKDYKIVFKSSIIYVEEVQVSAIADSAYLTGSFSINIINPVTLPASGYNNHTMVDLDMAINETEHELIESQRAMAPLFIYFYFFKDQNIREDVIDELSDSLKLAPIDSYSGSQFIGTKHNGKNYYSKLVFKFLPNKFISSGSVTYIPKPPLYTSSELPNISIVDWRQYALSFVDSTGDKDYPNANDTFTAKNSNHNPKRREVQSAWTTFAEIDVKKLVGVKDTYEFFESYNLTLNYQFKLNNWTSNWKWGQANGKNVAWSSASMTWTKRDDSIIGEQRYGDLNSGRKAYAAAKVHITIFSDTIKLSGSVESAFDWANGSLIHHAAFGLLKGVSFKIEPKKL